MTTVSTLAEMATMVMASASLAELRDRLHDYRELALAQGAVDDLWQTIESELDYTSLPSFGGDDPNNDGDGPAAWSWDHESVLIDAGRSFEFTIVPREVYADEV